MDTILLSDLLIKTKSALNSFNYKDRVIYRYEIEFHAIKDYFNSNGQETFKEEVLDEYVSKAKYDYNQQEISKTKFHRIRSASDKLLQFHQKGNIEWKRLPNLNEDNKQKYNGISREITDYKYYLDRKGLSYNTQKSYLRIATLFMDYIVDNKQLTLDNLSREEISSFIPHISQWYKTGSMSVVLTALRSFLNFLKEYNYCKWDMALSLPRKAAVKTTVYHPYTMEEEKRLLSSIDRSTNVGKRDYCLILLIMRTGLRTIDIIELMLNDIDWRRKTITVIQKKTNRPLVLPLLSEVGNSLADYILNGRPESNDMHLFLRNYSPYIGFQNPYSCSIVIKRYMKIAEIRPQNRNSKGAHSFRHSLASRLLNYETPLTVISSVLGHSDKQSTKKYLSTDLEHLRNCGLTLDGIEITKGVLS